MEKLVSSTAQLCTDFYHCCSSGRCDQVCACCNTAYFFCNGIECYIECLDGP